MSETITREQLNEAIEEFVDKIMEALGAATVDEEVNKPELTGTHFRAIDLNGEEVELVAEELPSGTVVVQDAYEYFRCYQYGASGPWVKYTGTSFDHNEFAKEMRRAISTPRIIHEG